MDKILVNVYIPTIDKTYEIFLPINLKIKYSFDIIQKTISELSDSNYVIRDDAILLEKRSMSILNPNLTVKVSGLKNGSDIIIM